MRLWYQTGWVGAPPRRDQGVLAVVLHPHQRRLAQLAGAIAPHGHDDHRQPGVAAGWWPACRPSARIRRPGPGPTAPGSARTRLRGPWRRLYVTLVARPGGRRRRARLGGSSDSCERGPDESRSARLALRLGGPTAGDRCRSRSARGTGRGARGADAVVHGPLLPDGGDGARRGPHARGLHGSRVRRRADGADAAPTSRHRRHLPGSRAAGQDRDDARRAVRRSGRVGHRRRVVRARAPRPRCSLPAHRRAVRAAGGDAADLPADVERGRMARTRAGTTGWRRRSAAPCPSASPGPAS